MRLGAAFGHAFIEPQGMGYSAHTVFGSQLGCDMENHLSLVILHKSEACCNATLCLERQNPGMLKP